MLTIPNIRTSVENQHSLILDPHAKNGTFLRDARGRLISYSGGFSVVYPYIIKDEKWVFRCWHSNLGNVRRRFNAISEAIRKSKAKYLCNFEYIDEGIIVEGKIYPTTRMRWVEGKNLKDYICKYRSDKKRLLQLAENFLQMVQEMHCNKLAHGDLQHGNIIVNDSGEIFLVDYDSFYCPSLKGEPEIVTGLKDYQHPLRSKNLIVSEKIDYFSELIIYLSILSIAYNPSLVDKYKVELADRLLFEASDFEDIQNSRVYSDIHDLGGEFLILLQILEIYLLKKELSDLLPFDTLIDQLTKDPIINSFKTSCGTKILKGKRLTLLWEVENYDRILLDGVDVTFKKSLDKIVDSSTSYKLEVINGRKKKEQFIKVDVFDLPIFKISASDKTIKKNTDKTIEVKWSVQNATAVTFLKDGKPISTKSKLVGVHREILNETSIYSINILALDEKTIITDSIEVNVFPEATFTFETDKEYVFPTIPFTLTWTTQNAKEVKLNGKSVDFNGTKVITLGIEKETKYILSVTDNFETKKKTITVKTLPIPRIESLYVPIPEIERSISMNVDLKVPDIKLATAELELSKVGLIDESLYNIEIGLAEPPQIVDLNYKLKSPSLWKKLEKTIHKLLGRNDTRK